MSNSPRLALPLLQAAQAQKHVTVNEAFSLVDGVVHLSLVSSIQTTPPGSAPDGDCYGVPVGGVNEWAGQDGRIALMSNGGWVFIQPGMGWQAWVVDMASHAIFDGSDWRSGALAVSPNGAATLQEIIEIDHSLSAGTTSTAVGALAASAMVIGITGRVTTALSGTLSTWRIGVAGSDDRYGSGLGLGLGSWLRGLTSAPVTYYTPTDLILTGESGDFAAGSIRLAIHVLRLDYPLS